MTTPPTPAIQDQTTAIVVLALFGVCAVAEILIMLFVPTQWEAIEDADKFTTNRRKAGR